MSKKVLSKTVLKTVLVFQENELINQITYPTKSIAKKHLSHFQKHGIIDSVTGNKIKNAKFELL